MSPINIYNPTVIGESGHGMFANVIYKCNCYSIITYVHTLMFHWNIVMVAISELCVLNFTVPFQTALQPHDVTHSAAVKPTTLQHKILKLSELLYS